MKKILGLDIGIASVGWGIIDQDTNNIIDAGVRLFESRDASKNAERRDFRQSRRLLRRRKNRVADMKKLLSSIFKEVEFENCRDVLKLRNKGLEEELTINELSACLLHIVKRRGITYLDDVEDTGNKASSDFQKSILVNQNELLNKYPCQIQLERLEANGKYRGVVESDGILLQNIYTTVAYVKETKKLLETQKQFHKELNDSNCDEIIKILMRKRKYYEGPGTETERTNYGIFKENGRTVENIFSELIGKCSIYKEELRAPAASYTAQLFNFLNDLNNLKYPGEIFTKEEKLELIDIVKNSSLYGASTIRKYIKNLKKVDEASIQGFRIDKSEKPLFHTFDAYRKLKKELLEEKFHIESFSIKDFDEIAYILTINTEKEGIIEAFKKSKNINNSIKENKDLVEFFVKFRKKNSSIFSKWHSLSLKAMKEIMDELLATSDNQSAIFHRIGKFKTNTEIYKEYSKIPAKLILENIYNPIASRSINETIKVVNAIIKKHGKLNQIVIEMPRDYISDQDMKNKIKKEQKNNENEISTIIKEIKESYGFSLTDENFYKHKELTLKLKLWKEQDGICLYSGKTIQVLDLIENKSLFDIDHILPISKTFDDSRQNKVLVYADENRYKGNQTPYYYFKSKKAVSSWNYESYKAYVLNLGSKKKIKQRKVNNFLFKEDINKYEILKGFIARNLNDTRYSARVILNSFTEYFKAHQNENRTNIKVVAGAYTFQFRKKLRLGKNRGESFAHNGVDALVCAYSYLGLNKFLNESLNIKVLEDGALVNYKTGELFTHINDLNRENISQKDYEVALEHFTRNTIRDNIINAERHMKFSHRVDTKQNRTVSNQTIYSTRKFVEGKKNEVVNYVVSKISDIYDDKDYEKFVKKYQKDKKIPPEKSLFLMRRYDPKTFEILEKIMTMYSEDTIKNPFRKYKEDYGDYIRKYTKKSHSPAIKQIKYLDEKVGSHIVLSKGDGLNKDVILKSLKPYRSDVYLDLEKNEYRLIGLKYSDFKYEKGQYKINKKAYNETLIAEKLIEKDEYFEDLLNTKLKFIFSLYKNSIFSYEYNNEEFEYRFLSRTMPENLNYMEVKPIEKSRHVEKGVEKPQWQIQFKKMCKKLRKIHTDVLGNKYYSESEPLDL